MSETGPSIEELRALARAVAVNARLKVEWGPAGGGWCLDPTTGAIRCDPEDAAREHPDESRGLVCHEAAHAAVTRYPHLIPRTVLTQLGTASLLNALEDCRIETWLASRFPGASAWIARYNDRLFPLVSEGMERRPRIHQYCLGAIHQWWHRSHAFGLSEEVIAALDDTAVARQRVIDLQPPIDVLIPTEGYAGSAVAQRFAEIDARYPPDDFERGVRLTAWEAWRVVWRDIRPVYETLVRLDLADRKQLEREDDRFLERIRGIVVPSVLGSRRPFRSANGERPEVRGALPAEAEAALRRVIVGRPADAYDTARNEVSALVDEMVQVLGPLLRMQAVPGWTNGHRGGARVDLRAAMQAQADPRKRDRIWQRKTVPHRHDPAVMLLLDLSGSMEGPGIREGFRGVVLLCEVLERLQIPFAVEGFQDRRIPFKGLNVPLDAAVRSQLGGMPAEVRGQRPGGHNRPADNWDGPVLRAASREVASWPMGHRVLIVVSDGRPSGPHNGNDALMEAVAEVETQGDVHIIGVGLGPTTEHVAQHYRTHLAKVPLSAFPAALGSVLAEQLIHPR